MKYQNIREEELKNKLAQDYFWLHDCSKIIGNVDFCVSMQHSGRSVSTEQQSLVWAEAKKGSSDIYKSIVQLILTIGKARTFDKFLPPAFLAAFDAEKIAFIPYNAIHEVFYINDFNWNVTPSNYDTKEFKLLFTKVKEIITTQTLLFTFIKDDKELKTFIKTNLVIENFGITKTKIDKNNFMVIYNKWLQTVKPTIAFNWDFAKKNGLIDGDFYLADILSDENFTLKDKLFVVLRKTNYQMNRHIDQYGAFTSSSVEFNDNQIAHTQFWNKYERPPKEEYWEYIVERRDLLVPQDIRERKGSFFTPQIWVERSQDYLKQTFGDDWQDEYYIWDCAAGTGNLLNGLTNKYNIWASTLDKQDVEVMHERIANGANLLDEHVFQFDFLNDDFISKAKGGKVPDSLYQILNNPEKRKKLVVYINPPYAEATTARTVTGTGENKTGVAKNNKIREQYRTKINGASNELFALFMVRIYDQIPNAKLALFSTLKFIQGSNFIKFKELFLAKFLKGFIIRANSFDNVTGDFPIGFTIWDLEKKENIKEVLCNIIENSGVENGHKIFYGDLPSNINKWAKIYDNGSTVHIAYMGNPAPDFQHNSQLYIANKKGIEHFNFWAFTENNIFHGAVYFSVRLCIKASWLNDRDQFLTPTDDWKKDKEFQNDCLAFTLFHSQNRISCKEGINHWIPFTEQEVNAREKFESNFMSQFLQGKIKPKQELNLFSLSEPEVENSSPILFSEEATAVFEAGKELYRYYHLSIKTSSRSGELREASVNASFYDIREYFQGRTDKGKMKNKSADETYTKLINTLKETLKTLAEKIEPKVYQYRFLRK